MQLFFIARDTTPKKNRLHSCSRTRCHFDRLRFYSDKKTPTLTPRFCESTPGVIGIIIFFVQRESHGSVSPENSCPNTKSTHLAHLSHSCSETALCNSRDTSESPVARTMLSPRNGRSGKLRSPSSRLSFAPFPWMLLSRHGHSMM